MSNLRLESTPPENVASVDPQAQTPAIPEPSAFPQLDSQQPDSQLDRSGNVKTKPTATVEREPSFSTEPRKKPSSPRSGQIRLGVALALPVFLETLDYTVVATAQPHIASAFNRLDLQSYIGTIYVLTSTVFLPIFASLADIFGRHWALQLSMFFFLLGSAISTGAQNITMVLAGRAVAGIGAAGLVTVVRVILADSRSLNTNNIQSSIIVILYAIGYSVGPVIGGALTTISFRWVFAINLPCTAVSMVLAFVLLRGYVKPAQIRHANDNDNEHEHAHNNNAKESILAKFERLDVLGAFLFIGGGILVLLGLNWGSTTGWNDAKVIATLVVGSVLAVAFVGWEWFAERPLPEEEPKDSPAGEQRESQTEQDPEKADHDIELKRSSPLSRTRGNMPSWFQPETMIPLEVFKNYDICATQFAAFSSGMVMLVNFYFLAIFFTIVLGKSANQAGVQLVYFAPGMGAGVFISIYLIKVLRQPKYPIIIGSFIVPVGLGLLSFAMDRDNLHLADAFLVVCGVGIGLGFGPLATQARFSQPESRVAIVIGLNLFFRTFGGTVGLAQCSAVLNAKVRESITKLAFSGTLTPSEIAQISSLGDISSIQAISELPPFLEQAVRDAFREGVRWAFVSLIPWTGISAVLVLFLRKIPDSDLLALRGGPGAGADADAGGENHDQSEAPAADGDISNASTNANQTRRSTARRKPKAYQPISLLIWHVRRHLREKKEEQERIRAGASSADVAPGTAV